MLEHDIFKRSRPDYRKLEAFGFKKEKGIFTYGELLPDRQFRAELTVTEEGVVSGRVIDLDTNEEYLPIKIENQIGGFVGNIREMYTAFLERVNDECFVPVNFMNDQANRIETLVYRDYDVAPEFPWEKYAGNGTFKCKGNDKWFAAILTVEFGKLQHAPDNGKSSASDSDMEPMKHDEEEVVECINLKAVPEEIPELTTHPGIYQAYHMNKKHWISVILDDTLTDEQVLALIRQSHDLVSTAKGTKIKGTGAWMIPSNPAVYDVDAGFRGGRGEIEWHQHNDVKPGDAVFIYCSAPYSAVI